MGPCQLLELGRDVDGDAEPLVAFAGSCPFRLEALRLARLLEEAAPLGQGPLGVATPFARPGQRVAIALQLGEAGFALLDRLCGRGDLRFGDLEPARVLLALGRELAQRPLELLLGAACAAVGAADARLESVAEGRLVTGEIAQLVMTHRC